MSQKLEEAIKSILSMGYYKNQAARSGITIHGHEDSIADRLIEAGFTKETNHPTSAKLIEAISSDNRQGEILKIFSKMTPGSFLQQPCGGNNFPDFLIRDIDGTYKILEAKSAKENSIAWNDNYPKKDCIYVFSSEKENKTTVFLGQDVITEEQQEMFNRLTNDIDKLVKEANIEMSKIDKYNRGWYFYSRPKYQQCQGQKDIEKDNRIQKTNYFAHNTREQCEKNVLEFVGK